MKRNGRVDKMEVQIQYLHDRQREIIESLEQINTKLDTVTLQLAELRGGIKMSKWLAGIMGAFAGGIITLVSHMKP